ncbi:MAG: hypothetical protein JNL02_02255 [Saprospiraceae bacterium]|nr:hypothetical protein [Saprospiraceae bacterium]
MLSGKDYSQMSLEELVAEEKKMSGLKTTTAVFVGFLFGIALFAATHKGFFLTVILIVAGFSIGGKHAQNLKSIRAEISRRENAH